MDTWIMIHFADWSYLHLNIGLILISLTDFATKRLTMFKNSDLELDTMIYMYVNLVQNKLIY